MVAREHWEEFRGIKTNFVFPKSRVNKRQPMRRPFVSMDCETYAPDGKDGTPHNILLWGFSSNIYTMKRNLSFEDIMETYEREAKRVQGFSHHPIYMGYGIGYEVTFLLSRLPFNVSSRIWKGGTLWTRYRQHSFQYVKDKWFAVARNKGSRFDWVIRVYEGLSWFGNVRLDVACRQYLPQHPYLERVSRGKTEERHRISWDARASVFDYWQKEQVILCNLMEHVRELIEKETSLAMPRQWYGPSALTSTVFQKYGVEKHLRRQEEMPDGFVLACQRAYFGGRFEPIHLGYHNRSVHQYDISSAYPHGQRYLWSWDGASIEHIPGDRLVRSDVFPEHLRFAVFRLSYRDKEDCDTPYRYQPLPLRSTNGIIYFPTRIDDGWYWAPEVKCLWSDPRVIIKEAYAIHPQTDIRPFQWYEDLFTLRSEYKACGNPQQYGIKITLNGGYGKTAQRSGAHISKGRWVYPKYHQLDWAGFVTSHCRAQIWDALSMVDWRDVLSIETDSIFLTRPLPSLPQVTRNGLLDNLGKWEETIHDGIIYLQSGVYWPCVDGKPKSVGKVRGVRRGSGGVSGEDGLAYLSRVGHQYRSQSIEKAHPLTGTVRTFHNETTRGGERYLSWTKEPRETTFGGSLKRRYMPCDDEDYYPERNLVKLVNYDYILQERFPRSSAPHSLPWRGMPETLAQKKVREQLARLTSKGRVNDYYEQLSFDYS